MKQKVLNEGTRNYLCIQGNDCTDSYSDNIFSYQTVKGFLPLEIRKVNGEKAYYFNITGYTSLEKYIMCETFSRNDIVKIINGIIDLEETAEEYLLEGNHVVIDEKSLFIDRQSGEICGVYMSDKNRGDVAHVSRLLEFVMEYMNQKDKELVFLVYELHRVTKELNCSIVELRHYLSADNTKVKIKTKNNYLEQPKSRVKVGGEGNKKKKPLQINKKRDVILAAAVFSVGLLIPVILYFLGMFTESLSGEVTWVKFAGAIAFFIAVSGYGAWKILPDSKDDIVSKTEPEKKMCLISRLGKEMPIKITSVPYVLEKAHILREGGDYFVVDEESETGTFCNGNRLVPWQKKRLIDGDILRLSRGEYVVEITETQYVI